MTKKLHKQYCSKTFRLMKKGQQILTLVVALILYAGAALAYFHFQALKPAIVLVTFGIYFTAMIFYGYKFSEWMHYRQLQDEHGKGIVSILTCYPDKIQVKVNKTSFSFKYSSITKAYETEELLILIIGANGMLEHGQMIYKSGFTQGKTVEEFKTFINKKTKKEIFS
mgnify:CR=1 FL=1